MFPLGNGRLMGANSTFSVLQLKDDLSQQHCGNGICDSFLNVFNILYYLNISLPSTNNESLYDICFLIYIKISVLSTMFYHIILPWHTNKEFLK